MRSASLCLAAALMGLAACGRAEPEVVLPLPPVPDERLAQPPHAPPEIEISDAAARTRDELLKQATRGSLRGLAAIAARNPDFKSNLGGQDHERFWDLLRRTGVDPNRKLRDLLDQPAGLREIDGERWYVWPDLAAKDAADLIPEKLTFQDRKRLLDLIGDEGVGRIRAGEGYPGMRTAISEEGVWIYFVLGQDGED
ncbi:hypothetical protein [Hyphomonas sp.]|uniref:hypothetical protein n=1 Tax=Hyphomonas sp. TaxID=87 RepID=UPI0025B83000|nr:hypothetical protein [Hyphomonas sp.]MBI1398517.1 hypothetical protein [Hyphomonas sp.]